VRYARTLSFLGRIGTNTSKRTRFIFSDDTYTMKRKERKEGKASMGLCAHRRNKSFFLILLDKKNAGGSFDNFCHYDNSYCRCESGYTTIVGGTVREENNPCRHGLSCIHRTQDKADS
jgi:hypothetical protein